MKLILTLALSIITLAGYSQDSTSRNAQTFRVYSGVPFQRVGSTKEWYNPSFELGFDLNHSLRIKKRFFISLGLGLNYSCYRTNAYVQTWTSISYSPLSGSTVHHNSDDFERQTAGRILNFRIPLQAEYMPIGKWTPYMKAGLLFDMEILSYSVDVYAYSLNPAPYHILASNVNMYIKDLLLSGTASGGAKMSKGNTELLFGLTSQFGFYDFKKELRVSRIGIGVEFSIRKTIPFKSAITSKDV